jgi:hypothetical protein
VIAGESRNIPDPKVEFLTLATASSNVLGRPVSCIASQSFVYLSLTGKSQTASLALSVAVIESFRAMSSQMLVVREKNVSLLSDR